MLTAMKGVKLLILSGILIPVLYSCEKDFLNRSATNAIPADKVWSDPALIDLYLNNMYAAVPSFDRDLYDNISDESRSFWGGNPRNILQGQWFADNNPMEYWSYDEVRKTNDFLNHIEDVKVDEGKKNELKGQVKFLRAMLYFNMVKRYGGVPVITVPQSLTDSLFVKKESTDSCFGFITRELTEAAGLLPETYGSRDIDAGKVTRNAATAFLGRVWLFWASPLYNPGNVTERWRHAAEISKSAIDKRGYELHSDFRRIMLDKNNNEEVFSVQFLKPYRMHGWDSWNKPVSQAKQEAACRSPLQEFVDAFEMSNGKGINDPGSGYDANNPYLNRDPRFYATVVENGSVFCGETISTYVGSEDGIGNPYCTITGYYFRKGQDEGNKDYYASTGSDQNWPELRFAEVLLNYAEAQNEWAGAPDATVYNAIERIRRRAGLSPYQLPVGLTKEEMRQRIRHERYIELSFENKRYWDLRRWKTAKDVLDGRKFTAMYITKTAAGTYRYERKPVDAIPCVFQDKMYFMPLPQRELEKNPNLAQNAGW